MRRFARLVVIVSVSTTTLPMAARAQTTPSSSTSAPARSAAQDPAQAPTQAPAEPTDVSRSLFELAPRQFELGGRVTSVSGDPARFQRYQDLRDGALFTNARYTHADGARSQLFRASADNVGVRGQRCT